MDRDPLIISTTQALTQALNKINNLIEATDTQVAASLLGIGASLCSESFVTCDVAAYKKYVDAELQQASGSSLHDDNSDSDEDDEKAYYNKTDVLVEDDNVESIDDVSKGEVDNKSNTGCPMDDNESLDAMESLYT